MGNCSAAVVLAGCIAIVACGGDRPADDWIGTWLLAAGSTDTIRCSFSGNDIVVDLTQYSFVMTASTNADLEMSSISNNGSPRGIYGWPDPRCRPPGAARVHFDVQGDVAATRADESCAYNVAMSGGVNYSVTSTFHPFTIAIDTVTMVTLDGHATERYEGSTNGTCTRTLAGTATKVAGSRTKQ